MDLVSIMLFGKKKLIILTRFKSGSVFRNSQMLLQMKIITYFLENELIATKKLF